MAQFGTGVMNFSLYKKQIKIDKALFLCYINNKSNIMIRRFQKHKKATETIGYAETAYLASISLILLLFIVSRGYINARKGTSEVRETT